MVKNTDSDCLNLDPFIPPVSYIWINYLTSPFLHLKNTVTGILYHSVLRIKWLLHLGYCLGHSEALNKCSYYYYYMLLLSLYLTVGAVPYFSSTNSFLGH